MNHVCQDERFWLKRDWPPLGICTRLEGLCVYSSFIFWMCPALITASSRQTSTVSGYNYEWRHDESGTHWSFQQTQRSGEAWEWISSTLAFIISLKDIYQHPHILPSPGPGRNIPTTAQQALAAVPHHSWMMGYKKLAQFNTQNVQSLVCVETHSDMKKEGSILMLFLAILSVNLTVMS